MALRNFGLLASIWGASAKITHVEFHEFRQRDGSSWQVRIVARDGQMFLSNVNGQPKRWTNLDAAVRDTSGAIPPLAEMKIVRAVSRSAARSHLRFECHEESLGPHPAEASAAKTP